MQWLGYLWFGLLGRCFFQIIFYTTFGNDWSLLFRKYMAFFFGFPLICHLQLSFLSLVFLLRYWLPLGNYYGEWLCLTICCFICFMLC
jgi:hypothetical protein